MGGGSEDVALAPCSASMALDGSITIPLVRSGGETFSYTFEAAATETSPARFVASRQAADPAAAGCGAVVLASNGAATIEAAGIGRYGQVLSISFQEDGAGAFRKVAATIKGGNLDGTAGELTPLAGAMVSVSNTAGTVVATGHTNEWGAMIVTIGELPDSFRVTATGGTMSGAPFIGSLKAEVRDYSTVAQAPQVTLTPLSTLVSAYQERYPGLSLAETMNHVEGQLNIPLSFDSDAVGQGAGDYFDASVFYAQAQAAGGVDTLVQKVLTDWEDEIEHRFVPAIEVDRQEPTQLINILVPSEALANLKAVPCSGNCLGPLRVGPVDVIGGAYAIYAGERTAQWQADVVNRLIQIDAQLKRLDSAIDDLTTKVVQGNYQASKNVARPWVDLVKNAFTALAWLAVNPAKDYLPSNLAACNLVPVPTAQATACNRWAGWNTAVTERRALIAKVTSGAPGSAALAAFEEALAGNAVADGMLKDHRASVYGQVSKPSERKFFTPAHSNQIWDHYRYWTELQALGYFFFADHYIGTHRGFELESTGTGDSRVKGLTELHNDAVAKARSRMPMRVLPGGTYIDVHNTTYYGQVVGGPLMWMPARTLCSLFQIPFDQANVSVQNSLSAYINCLNTQSDGHGLRDWKLPTEQEWYAFTQQEGGAGRDLGTWMTERGMDAGTATSLKGSSVYAAFTRECVGSYSTHGQVVSFPCSRFKYYFDYTSSFILHEWRPFMVLGTLHRLQAGTQGWVYPVRAVNVNEYW